MHASVKGVAFRELERLFQYGVEPVGDAALVGRFVVERSEAAFEALVARHGPMVLGVCRRVLGSVHDAEDAFQATFLVLARNAGRLRDPDRVGPWLYGVARRVAGKARVRAGRYRHRHQALEQANAHEQPSHEWSDVLPILDAEIGRLPAKHREVLVLCLLQGATTDEASTRLGCPAGTVKSRLARGRESLRARLVARGVAPALAGLIGIEVRASSVVPEALTRATLETIAGSAVAPKIVALTKGAVSTMFSKLTVAAAVIIGGTALGGAGTAAWMRQSAAQGPGPGAQDSPERMQTTNNLKQILLALHNVMQQSNGFPASATYGSDGQPKLSWRVAILPFLDQSELYEQFRQDEPWDSPHNSALIARMPAVFETPGLAAPPGQTHFRGFAGKGAFFEGVKGTTIAEFTDGTSNTIALAVAREPAVWTRPGELPFVAGQSLSLLEKSSPDGYTIAMADGSVRSLAKCDEKLLSWLITRNHGEVIDWGRLEAAATTAAASTPAPAPRGFARDDAGSTRAIERRLAIVEEKLDVLIQKLDAVLRDGEIRRRSDGNRRN